MSLSRHKAKLFPAKYIGYIGFGLFFNALSGAVLANCSFINGATSEIDKGVNFGSVIVQRDTPAGTVLAITNTGPYHNSYPFFGCTVPWIYRWSIWMFGTPSPLGGKIFATNIDGIGIVISNESNADIVPAEGYVAANTYISIPRAMRVELVKTKAGAVGAGKLATGILARASIAGVFFTASVTLVGDNTIIPVACSVTNTSIDVPMGDSIPMTAFTGPGSVAAETPFAIELNCDANTRVQLKLEGIPHASGAEGVLALDSSPSDIVASGIGLQVLYNDMPVKLATDITVGTVASDGPYSIPLTARYYQTGASVSGGVANSTATFTLTYN